MEQCPWSLEVGTGLWNFVPSLVKRYFDQSWPESLEHHPSLATLWDESIVSKMCAQFPFKGIQIEEEFSLMDHKLYRATYTPGKHVTWGPTRFYRGEYLLQKKNTKMVYPLRSGLPTFTRHPTFPPTFDHVVVTPKFDGNLVNILFIPLQHPYYKLLKAWFQGDRNEFGLFLVGSKQNSSWRILSVKSLILCWDTKVLTRLSVPMTRILRTKIASRRCTTFTKDDRRFALAKPSDVRVIPQKTFQTKDACEAYLEELHDQFLKGDTLCEPEGCVLYFWDAQGCLVDIVKKKFPEYLAVVNPNKYPKQYQETLTNPLLAERFQKIRKLKKDLDTSVLKKAIQEFLKKDTKDRKEYALYLEENRFKIQEFQTQLDEIAEKARMKARNIRQELFLNYPYI
ncbi:uncharacterized protein TNCT_123931 [Trichonephila clavata]|uniref:Uncharacterized protein n=1 Tax=Trichonephila clavata TaxID=2740835 RepID=A0A8X6FC18_TRICU|nr:uncharacterized protein TNCT_123931 [Trichonephila clavata]